MEPGAGLAESDESASEIYRDAARHTGCNDIARGCVGSGVWWEWVEHPYRSEPVRHIGHECDVFRNGDEFGINDPTVA